MDMTPRMSDNALLARTAAAAGMVLLKNVENTLPLEKKEDAQPLRLAVFGVGQVYTTLCSASMQPWRKLNILDGLRGCGELTVDGLLAHKYTNWCLEHPQGEEMPLGSLSMEELQQENDAAVVVISRKADDTQPRLTPEESQMIQRVCGAFSRSVLVLNTPGYIQLGSAAQQCKALVYMGIPGQEGGGALADLLTGKVVFTGKLAFSWPLDEAEFDKANAVPDCFTGYRYFDSFGTPLLYGFGHGLGYGACALTDLSVALDGCELLVSATVENTGERFPVQETVQVYASTPDESAPVWELAAFQKSRLLEPGQKQRVDLRFPITQLARYHSETRAYVLDAGYYDLRIGTESRSSYVAGSIRLTRSAVVKAAVKLPFSGETGRLRGTAFTYPEEAAELESARQRAIRFSDRNLPRSAHKKGREFTGCRSDGQHHSLSELQAGRCTPFQLVAALDDATLRSFVCDFGFCPSEIPGALGASRSFERYGIPAVHIAAGSEGVHLTREIKDEFEETVIKRQNCTAFPAASLLACSFDPELIRAVGVGIGRELKEYGLRLWLAPGVNLRRSAAQEGAAELWSEDPLVCGLCAAALAEGVSKHALPVLRTVGLRNTAVDQEPLRNLYLKSLTLACRAYPAALLPDLKLGDEFCGEDGALVRALILDSGFGGLFLCDRERYNADPTRVTLEKSALRLIKNLF